MSETAIVDGVQILTYASCPRSVPRAEWEAWPSRQSEHLNGLPVHGVSYRDEAHPNVRFECVADMNWSRYGWRCWPIRIVE